MYEILKARNSYLHNDLINFTQKLIKTKSVSLHEKKVAEICEKKMKELGYDKVFTDSVGNVVGIIYGRKYHPTVMLASHMDAVTPNDIEKWETDPYKPVIKDDYMYGVGTSDCKAGLAAQIFSGALLKNSLLPLNGNLVVTCTVAEENGLSVGVKTLLNSTLKEINLFPDYIILGEPTDLNIYYGHDGWVQYDILIDGYNNEEVSSFAKEVYENFTHLNENTDEFQNFKYELLSHSSLKKSNTAKIACSKRLGPHENYHDFLAQLNHSTHLMPHKNSLAVQVKLHEEQQKLYNGYNTIIKYMSNAWETSPNSLLIQKAVHALQSADLDYQTGKWKLKKLKMGTSGSVIKNDFNIPVIGYGPGDESFAHEKDERVKMDNITNCVYGTASIVHSLIGVPVFGWTSDEI